MDRPILFSTEMVRAILRGTKTQTRRVMMPQPIFLPEAYDTVAKWLWRDADRDIEYCTWGTQCEPSEHIRHLCKHGQIGDRLWVREAIGIHATPTATHPGVCVYRADFPDGPDVTFEPHWTPSLHMPRWACRITLEVTDVRLQRLQAITEEDAKAEGATAWHDTPNGTVYLPEFRALWDRINAKRGYGWDGNPWVWAISFKRLEVQP